MKEIKKKFTEVANPPMCIFCGAQVPVRPFGLAGIGICETCAKETVQLFSSQKEMENGTEEWEKFKERLKGFRL